MKTLFKEGCMLAPVPPALISCGNKDKINVMTAAWTGIINSEPPMTYVSIRKSRLSYNIISESKEFVINLPNLPLAFACDFCGVKSGRNVNKFKEMKLTPANCSKLSTVMIEEAPVSLECKVKNIVELGSHDMFTAEIVSVSVDDKYIDKNGRICFEKMGLLAYVHGGYYTLGRYLGKFGWSVEKKKHKNKK
jgi:flavin reductase (DIM6/NTAB) family NADH-FMN oxidoreductase RutF